MQKLCFLLMSIALCAIANAQSYLPSAQKEKWEATQGSIKLNEHEAIVAIAFDKKTKGLARIDEKGAEKWTTQFSSTEPVLAFSKLGPNILVFTAKDISKSPYAPPQYDKINGILIDAESGKLVQEKIIFQLPATYVEMFVLNNPAGELQSAVLRYSKWNGQVSVFTVPKMTFTMPKTDKLEVYAISNDLTPTLGSTYSSFPDNIRFDNLTMSSNGDLTVFSFDVDKQQYIAEQFANGVKKRTVSVPMALNENWSYTINSRRYVNPANNNNFVCLLSYNRNLDHYIKAISFDLEKGSAKEYQREITNSYRDEVEKNALLPTSKKAKLGKGSERFETAIGLTMYNDQPITITEFGGDGRVFTNSHGLITVFNQDMTVQKQFLFPKELNSAVGSFGDGVAYYRDGNKLRLLANDHRFVDVYILYGEIDLDKLSWTKYETVKKDGRDIAGHRVYNPGILWFPNNMLMTRRAFTISNDFEASGKLIPVSYE